MSFTDPYVYPGSRVLRNKAGIRDQAALDVLERVMVVQRRLEPVPGGAFDAAHLKAIHHHFFQDIYDWAGEFRTIEIAKGGSQFQFCRFVPVGVADIHRRIVERRFFVDLTARDFANAAAEIIGDLNYAHPFRDGNGRTQTEYLRQLAARAGWRLHIEAFEREPWIDASRAAHHGDYQPFAERILHHLSN